MPRRARSSLPDGIFHVTSRGVDGLGIYVDDADRIAFRAQLADVTRRFGWIVYAYCLMTTHYHVVVGAQREALSAGMHRLNGLHAQRFNRRHERRGHLFENRYSAFVVDDHAHLVAAIVYVRDNPVRAGLCRTASDWPWADSAF